LRWRWPSWRWRPGRPRILRAIWLHPSRRFTGLTSGFCT